MEMIKALEKATNEPIPYQVCPRRPGDLPSVYADPTLAMKELGWTAKRDLQDMCKFVSSLLTFHFMCLAAACRQRFMAMAIEQSQWISLESRHCRFF